MVVWLIILSIIIFLQGVIINDLRDRVERFESWYPFCELMKMKFEEESNDTERKA